MPPQYPQCKPEASPSGDTLPLPVSWDECRDRGWSHLDVLLVTGDSYIDHPSFGVALIGRLLEAHGCKVAVLSQPAYHSDEDFRKWPTPQLFCGITAGNLDSIVANYSGNGKVRNEDAYSPDGNPWRDETRSRLNRRRPDRATLVYTSLARSAFGNIPIVLGGIEASLRRFVHYDFQQQKLRGSVLSDSKADLLVYGMGEKAIIQIAKRCRQQSPLDGIAGTCLRLTSKQVEERFGESAISPESTKNDRHLQILPSWNAIQKETRLFLEGEIVIDRHSRAESPRLLLQQQQDQWILQFPAPRTLSSEELDELYRLPFSRKPHPAHHEIPAYRMIKDSITIVRGCSGNCSFCAITRHQGARVVSRSVDSIVEECKGLSQRADFRGTISDLGGPTANLFASSCKIGGCKKKDCLYPRLCNNLELDEKTFLQLLKKVSALPEVKNVFISSGLRMEPLLQTPQLLQQILNHHTPGSLKIAPEHTVDSILELMHKEPHELLVRFLEKCRSLCKQSGKKTPLFTPYIITSHPGSTLEAATQLANDLKKQGLVVRKFQDFTPTPGTISTAMFVTGLRADNFKPLHVPKTSTERTTERRRIEESFRKPAEKKRQVDRAKEAKGGQKRGNVARGRVRNRKK